MQTFGRAADLDRAAGVFVVVLALEGQAHGHADDEPGDGAGDDRHNRAERDGALKGDAEAGNGAKEHDEEEDADTEEVEILDDEDSTEEEE